MKKILNILLLIAVVLLAGQCKKDDPIVIADFDYGYYPIDTGMWWLYDMEEMAIDIDDNDDTVLYYVIKYQIKEIIESVFTDNEGRVTYRIERYKRDDESDPYIIKDVWYSNLLNYSAEKVEENVRYVKLRFPLTLNKSWNGNAYNVLGEETYNVASIDEQEIIGSSTYDSLLVVTALDEENLIERKYKAEKYAKGIGLVYRINMDVSSQIIIPNIPVEQRIRQGSIYSQQLVDYGIE